MKTRRTEVVRTRRTGNVREKAGKKKKDGKRKNVQQKEDKRVSEEGLSGGRIVEDNKSREKEKTVDQKKKDEGGRVCNKREVSG